MRIGLDAQLARGTATGIGEYVRGLAVALREIGVDVVLLESRRLDPWRFDRRVLWDQALLPLAAARANVDLMHCASGTLPLVCAKDVVATVHDVAWLRVQGHARPYARAYFGRFQLAQYARARALIVDSDFSRAELLELASIAPERVEVVYPGVAADVMAVSRAPDEAAPFVLAVGTVEARKNLAVLVRALPELPELRLVAVGPPTPYRDAVLALARDLGVAERLEIRGYVPRAEVLALYARALACAVPSYYEGFGYGVAQALCAGVPVVAARSSSLPEVAGGAATLVAPGDVAGWAAALGAIAANPVGAQRAADAARRGACRRFGWAQAARDIARVYAGAVASR